jgi:HK97 family phage portal protein
MGILGGIGRGLRFVADSLDLTKPRDEWDPQYWGALGGGPATAGVIVNRQNASQLGAVQAVRHGLTSAMQSLPISVYRREGDARVALPDHPVTKLFACRPNDRQTPAEFIGEIAWHLSFERNAFCALSDGAPGDNYYAVGGLEIIHPARLALLERREDGHIYYTFNPPATILQAVVAPQKTYRDDQLWHLRGNPLTEDGLLGTPIYQSAKNVFARAIAVHEYGDIWFANSGQTGGIIEHPGNFKDKEAERDFLDTWRRSSVGKNRHRDRLLKYGGKYTALKVTNSEAQFLESEKAADIDLFGLWSYPQHRASRLERATNNNIEQQSLDFVVCSLAPVAIQIEQAIERDMLLGDSKNLFVEFNFAGLLRGDLLNRYKAYLLGRQGEWLSANDILRFENMSPRKDPGGDDYKNPLTKDSGAAGVDDPPADQGGNNKGDGNGK